VALTTRAKVLEQLGLVDDEAAVVAPAIAVSTAGSPGQDINIDGTTLNAGQTGSTLSYDLTQSDYDTIGEVVTLLDGLDNIGATIVDSALSGLASTLLIDPDIDENIEIVDEPRQYVINYTKQSGLISSYIDTLIPEVEAEMERYCDRDSFESAAYTDEVTHGRGSRYLMLKNAPIDTGETITVKYRGSGTTTTTVDSSSFRVYGDGTQGMLESVGSEWLWDGGTPSSARSRFARREGNGIWPDGKNNLLVSYTGGYSTVPADLEAIARQRVVDRFLSRRDHREAVSEALGGASVTYRTPAESDERFYRLLAPFRRVIR
jgi:hypothetical protein